MKYINYPLTLVLSLTLLLTSCVAKNSHKEYFVPVKCYHTNSKSNGDFWLYLMLMNNKGALTYYSMTSPIPITNFAKTIWVATPTIPADIKSVAFDARTQVIEESVAVNEFDSVLANVINENAKHFEGMVTEEVGNHEHSNVILSSNDGKLKATDSDGGDGSSD